jgi:truncated hemoglobin YjbI
MFAALDVPVLGVVENMTGAFGGGAGQSVCAELGVSFLGELPFDAEIVREGDIGTPTMVARPDSASAASFDTIAQQIAEALGWHRVAPPVPRDIEDADLEGILISFYSVVAKDPLLAPYFADIDMIAHMPRIVAFWSTLLFHTGRYSGNAFRPHESMPGLAGEHFSRWVATLEGIVDARFAGPAADRMKDIAHRIAYSMQVRLGITPFAEFRPDASSVMPSIGPFRP